MKSPIWIAGGVVALLMAAACTDRDRGRGDVDSGPVVLDSGTVDGAVEGGVEGGIGVVDAGSDAGPPIGSCLGACGAPAAAECPSYDRAACQEQCVTDQSAAEEAGCGMEFLLYLGCRQSVGYSCNASGEPETNLCDDQEDTWQSCVSG